MRGGSAIVLGGGFAGLAATLLLARDGRDVVLVERDPLPDTGPDAIHDVPRRGVPHYFLPHAFIPRGRSELRRLLPDVYDALIAAGAHDVDCRPKLPGDPRPGDEELQYVAVRRPLIEWAMRQAIAREPRVAVRSDCVPTGLVMERGRVVGAVVGGHEMAADVVVDALGRRTPTPQWLAAHGVVVGEPETTDCGVVYYARYYRQRPGFDLPDGPWLLSPRGDLGYCAYATFPGDNGAFAGMIATPRGVQAWRGLTDPAVYEAACAKIPPLASWVDPDGCDPITGVMPMAGLRNSLRSPSATAPGLFAVGDAIGHTDPLLAHGLAFGLVHAGAVVDALNAHTDVGDAVAAYECAVRPWLQERFAFVSQLDAQRLRMWLGEPVDLAHADGDYALFSMAAGGAAAAVDGDVARAFARRIGLLDSTDVLDRDPAMRRRIEDVFAQLSAQPRPPAGPPREEMLSLVSAHG